MNIGIDIDDTITDTFDYLKKYVAEYFNISLEYLDKEEISYSNLPEEYKSKEFEFGKKYYAKILNDVPVKEKAIEHINKLKEMGFHIYIITARDERLYSDAYKSTKEQMDYYGIQYDKIICTFNKLQACIDNNIDLMIDDSISTCNNLYDKGISVILYNSIVNKDIEVPFKRVNDWCELYNYIIKNN